MTNMLRVNGTVLHITTMAHQGTHFSYTNDSILYFIRLTSTFIEVPSPSILNLLRLGCKVNYFG